MGVNSLPQEVAGLHCELFIQILIC